MSSTLDLLLPPPHRLKRYELQARYGHIERPTCPPALVAELLRHLDPTDAVWRRLVAEALSEEYGERRDGPDLWDAWAAQGLEPGTVFREWSTHAVGPKPYASRSLPAMQRLFNRAYNLKKVPRRMWWFAGGGGP